MKEKPTLTYSERTQEAMLDALRPIRHLLEDESINEIMVNGPNDVFIRQRGPDKRAPVTGLSEATLNTAITLLASYVNKEVNDVHLTLSARLPQFRVECILKPVGIKGSAMCIRRHATRIIGIQEYIESGVMTSEQAAMIQTLVKDRKNILIAGGTYSGKTTLMNCILALVDPHHRLFVIEQIAELKIAVENYVQVECDPDFDFTPTMAVRRAMRFSPNRIILGELRGPEAKDFLSAANTGHPGSMATLHANSGNDALKRLGSLVLEAGDLMPHEVIQERIAGAVEAVIFIEERYGVRRLAEICHVKGYDRNTGKFETEVFTHPERLTP